MFSLQPALLVLTYHFMWQTWATPQLSSPSSLLFQSFIADSLLGDAHIFFFFFLINNL
jgi:hypothetical protein